MARERAFDHEVLKRLVLEHPEWPDEQYAAILTERNRAADPTAPPVNVNTVASVLHRKRDVWDIPARWVTYAELIPPTGLVSVKYKNCTILRHLRELAADERGQPPSFAESGRQRRQSALSWRDKTVSIGGIVDLDMDGKPIIRRAVKSELDANGKPLALVAWMITGWGS